MRLRHLILVLALLVTAKAKAQVGIYGTFTGTHVGDGPFLSTSSGFWTLGGGVGVYDDFTHFGPLHLGADLRGTFLNSGGHKLNSVLGGVRLAVKPPVLPIKPYLQASVGAGSTNAATGSSATSSGVQYQFFGGLDLTFFPRLDWRMVEVGGGQLHANGANYTVTSIGTGIVFRLPIP